MSGAAIREAGSGVRRKTLNLSTCCPEVLPQPTAFAASSPAGVRAADRPETMEMFFSSSGTPFDRLKNRLPQSLRSRAQVRNAPNDKGRLQSYRAIGLVARRI